MKTRAKLFGILWLVAMTLVTIGCSAAASEIPEPDYWPTDGWRTEPPGQHGLDSAQLDGVDQATNKDLPFLDSLIVIRDGYVVYEAYFNGYSVDSLHNLASVTKSWTSAAVGIARGQGQLTDLEAELPDLLPTYFEDGQHDDKRDITLEDLLTMRSGIEFDDNTFVMGGYGGLELLKQDLTAFALDFPMQYEPGETWNYSSLDSQLLSEVIEKEAGRSVKSIVADELFEPMGISKYEWLQDATGTTVGGGNLSLTPRDMAKLGLLYLHHGQWQGEQLIPQKWVERSLTPQDTAAYYKPSDQSEIIDWYGYHWWTWDPDWFHGHRAFQAQGYGGQQVLVLPDLNLIIVTTAQRENISPEVAGEQENKIYSLIHDDLLPALAEVEANN